ncbi:MAG: antirestriction protein ArdA [Paracoccaceae bacterium]
MDSQKLNPVDRIVELVSGGENFVLQGGAGSGKTESLKRVVQKVLKANLSLRIACITHTNKAADEIADRVSSDIKVSTIHSFLGQITSLFKKNIQQVFPKLFELPEFVAFGDDHYDGDEKVRKKKEHDRFKKAHGQLENRRRTVLGEDTEKVTGKRDYDKAPDTYNAQLNGLIGEVNKEIHDKIAARQLVNHLGSLDGAKKAIEDAYAGEYKSLADFAVELTEQSTEIPESLRFYIDYEAMARDIEINDVFTIDTGFEQVHVFWSH